MGWRAATSNLLAQKNTVGTAYEILFLLFKQMGIGVTDLRVLQKWFPWELTLRWGVAGVRAAPSSSAQSCGTGAHPRVRDFWRPLKGSNLYM